ncbi:MAG: B12-binding domain-containing radical SAM protein [Planctomycetes bacterium]|nr:B12-binding domain-containing radical SAM protein [Planctomycetota bacterium]
MKILFVSAINSHVEIEVRYPQLGLGYLAGYIRKKLGKNTHEVKVINNNVETVLKTFKPDIVGISCLSPNYSIAKRYAALCKKQNLPVIVGGMHISLMPESISRDMDVGVMFEGEETIAELVQSYDRAGIFDADNLSSIKGICYRSNGQPVFTQSRPLIDNLDDIPRPARELLNIKGSHLSMFTSRGCPYRCVFCASSRFWASTRFASAHYIAEEIKELYYNYGAKLISFYDDLFIVQKQRLKDLTDILSKEGILGKVRFSCSARSNLIDNVMVKLMKELGIVSVALGLESGHPRILEYLKGKSVTVQDNITAVNALAKKGITPNAAFVIGSSIETKEEIMTTYKFIKSVPLRNFNVYVMTPLPGTPVWSEAVERGLISKHFDNWSVLDAVHFAKHYKKAIILSRHLSREQLYKIYKKFQLLRYWIFFKNAYLHPFVKDIPKMFWNLTKEKIAGLIRT